MSVQATGESWDHLTRTCRPLLEGIQGTATSHDRPSSGDACLQRFDPSLLELSHKLSGISPLREGTLV